MNDYSQLSNRRFIAKQINYRNPYFHKESPHERKHRFRKLYTLLLVIISAGILYVVVYSPLFKISTIDIKSGNTSNTYYINILTGEYLDNHTGFIFPNDNWLFLSPNNLKNFLIDKVEQKISLEYLTAEKKVWNKIEISFEERTATALIKDNESYYYLDNQGVVVSQYIAVTGEASESNTKQGNNENISQLPNFPIIEGETQSVIGIGTNVLPAKLVKAIIEIDKIFSDRIADLEISHFTTVIRKCYKEKIEEDDEVKEIDVCPQNDFSEFGLITTTDLTIYFTSNQDSTEQINSLYLSINEELETSLDKLNYIDLRYLPRVYYK